MLSRKADYALRAMVELIANKNDVVSTKDLAKLTQVPYAFMAKIVAELASHNLVTVSRGYGGGIKVSADPAKVSALQVIEAINGPLILNRCLIEPKSCSRTNFCSMHQMLKEAHKQLVKSLSINLKTLAKNQNKKKGEADGAGK